MHADKHLSVVSEEPHGCSRNQLHQNFLECIQDTIQIHGSLFELFTNFESNLILDVTMEVKNNQECSY